MKISTLTSHLALYSLKDIKAKIRLIVSEQLFVPNTTLDMVSSK